MKLRIFLQQEHIKGEKYVCSGRTLSIRDIVDEYGQHPVSTDGGGTWYPQQTCQFLQLLYHIHSSYEKSIIERTMQYIKDRTMKSLTITFLVIKEKRRNVN